MNDPLNLHSTQTYDHLMQFLWDRYCAHLETLIAERKEAGDKVVDLATAKKRAGAVHFLKWAIGYLNENRVAEQFFIDDNIGIRLNNMESFALCPGSTDSLPPGSMQKDTSVAITEGRERTPHNALPQDNSSLRI